jgi:hypothetical protein
MRLRRLVVAGSLVLDDLNVAITNDNGVDFDLGIENTQQPMRLFFDDVTCDARR